MNKFVYATGIFVAATAALHATTPAASARPTEPEYVQFGYNRCHCDGRLFYIICAMFWVRQTKFLVLIAK
jgi:hypothetical protein